MEKIIISGIQQAGVGVANMREAWKWYKKYFGMNIRMFEEAAVAGLMLPYTGGEPRSRHAALALNMSGGGGFEIWQYTERIPQPPTFGVRLGDLGIYSVKIKSKDIGATYRFFKSENLDLVSDIVETPEGEEHFFVRDPYGNIFDIVPADTWFVKSTKGTTGAVYGAIIGVTDMETSMKFYAEILGYDIAVYDTTSLFADFGTLPGGDGTFRRVLLRKSVPESGPFHKIFGPSEIELVQAKDRQPEKIFKGRFWGDLGFIHLCFDIRGMDALRKKCAAWGCPFTVDSGNTFDMGEAAGIFSYIEDPDGALIEFVETHKIPVIKKLGVYIDLRKRPPFKALPGWMLRSLRFNKAHDI